MDEKHFLCFKTGLNTGLKYGRIDVVGVRDIGDDLSGEVEIIAIEVKRGEWDSNPRVLSDMGLAIPRPTRLGDPRPLTQAEIHYINHFQSARLLQPV